MSEEIDYASRVAKGIALLDEKWPDWATEIDLDTLDIASNYSCMTAQYDARRQGGDAIGFWRAGMRALGLDRESYGEHGFNGSHNDFVGESVHPAAYAVLNGLWKAEILRRRAQAQDAPAEPEATA